jgi:uncharacterized membrane protein
MSTELITPRTVEKLFEKFQECLPEYVPAFPSLIRGMVVTIVITIIGVILGLRDKNETAESKDIVLKTRWIIVVLVFSYIGLQIGDIVKDKHYMIKCLVLNKQHFANVHWLREYKNAIK